MEETTKTIDRLNDGADKLAKAIRQGHRATSDVSIPIAFEEIRLAVEERFEEIKRLKETEQADASVRKYEFTGETRLHGSVVLRQICRISDGEIGGWIESEANLSHEGDCWVSSNAQIYGDCWVSSNAQIYGDAKVFGDAEVFGNAHVFGDAHVYGNAHVFGDAKVCGNAQVHGNAHVRGNAKVSSNAQVYGDAKVFGGLIR